MLKIDHLTKVYGDKKAVDDLSLHIRPGEIYGFIGHNGAGKTTTLKAVVGILQPDAGEITVNGHSVKAQPLACKQKIAYIPDNPDLYEFMTGIQYLNFIADIFGVSAQERQARIHKYADSFEIEKDLVSSRLDFPHDRRPFGIKTFHTDLDERFLFSEKVERFKHLRAARKVESDDHVLSHYALLL